MHLFTEAHMPIRNSYKYRRGSTQVQEISKVEEITEKFSYSLVGYAKPKILHRIPLFSLNLPSEIFFVFSILDDILYKNTLLNVAMPVWLTEKKKVLFL